MSPITDRKLRFSAAAYAIGATPKTLRNWLQRKQVQLSDDDAEGWRTFNHLDIAHLAIVRRMVDFGMEVETAHRHTADVMSRNTRLLASYKNTPVGALKAAFMNKFLVVTKSTTWNCLLLLPSDEMPEESDAYLMLDLAKIVGTALERADDMHEEDNN